jgi:hypothetical protein
VYCAASAKDGNVQMTALVLLFFNEFSAIYEIYGYQNQPDSEKYQSFGNEISIAQIIKNYPYTHQTGK